MKTSIMQTDPGPAGPDAGPWDGEGINTQDACTCGAKPGVIHANGCPARG